MSQVKNKIHVLSEESFDTLYANLGVAPRISKTNIYVLYKIASENAQAMIDMNIMGKFIPLNPVVLILYIINEYGFLLDISRKSEQEMMDDEKVVSQIVSTALDKYFTNEHFSYQNENRITKYNPQISSLTIYLNFILGVLKKYSKNTPQETLLLDIMQKGFSMMKAIADMIVDGFSTEAFSTWRTLHETECILRILDKYGEKTVDAYLKHLKYALAFRLALSSKEEIDATFVDIKREMAEHGLKSKDMKKFIEYGWLYSVDDVENIENFKLNFRDGVEKVAELSQYSKTYEMASEIAHSSPILIYSRNEYFLHRTLINIYESFFRMEDIFNRFYMKGGNELETRHYPVMRQTYLPQLAVIHKLEIEKFKSMNSPKKEENT